MQNARFYNHILESNYFQETFGKADKKKVKLKANQLEKKPSFLWQSKRWMNLPSDLQEFPEIFVHALRCQLLQAVVTMDDTVCSHYHHPNAVGVLAKLAANGWAHNHVQATVTATCISVIMAREDCLHAWRGVIDIETKKRIQSLLQQYKPKLIY